MVPQKEKRKPWKVAIGIIEPKFDYNECNQKERKKYDFRERKWYLNSTVVLMVIETERAESTVHAIQAVHIAFTLVGISVQLALNKEALSEQRFQPWRPPVVLFIRTSSALFSKTKRNPVFQLDSNIKNHSNSNQKVQKNEKNHLNPIQVKQSTLSRPRRENRRK